ncbi:hypothetical protein PYJP_02260 [Pyrofollis japonicus]|uniref:hypothetical protein n=1 Tax=Pyrofollis japonicus TaxID=3060460 RepID=UPI00295C2D69|nr:hypothetical protein [Pyrofollis japonicus]BEP16874.1 hypothetical protein PYJP_02260 [Pyrofollis japonicus]
MHRALKRLFVLEPASRPATCSEVLGLGELGLDYALGSGMAYLAYTEWPRSCRVYGIYEALEDEGGDTVARRITGGIRGDVDSNRVYVALSLPGVGRLRDAVAKMLSMSQCLGGRVHGATVMGTTAFIEVVDARRDPLECVREVLGAEKFSRVRPPRMDVLNRARLFDQDSWRLYRYRRASVEAMVRRNEYWLRASLEVTDGYITGYWLSGVFYSAPPTEIYSVFNTLRGTRLDEVMLANMEIALEKRLEVEGLETRDLIDLVNMLYRALLKTGTGN